SAGNSTTSQSTGPSTSVVSAIRGASPLRRRVASTRMGEIQAVDGSAAATGTSGASLAPAGRVSPSVAMWATTTATMISGPEPEPAGAVSRDAIITADNGRRRTHTVAAAMQTATPGVVGNPGRCDAMIPAAAPRNNAGKVGPPRKLPSDSPYAIPLKTISQA